MQQVNICLQGKCATQTEYMLTTVATVYPVSIFCMKWICDEIQACLERDFLSFRCTCLIETLDSAAHVFLIHLDAGKVEFRYWKSEVQIIIIPFIGFELVTSLPLIGSQKWYETSLLTCICWGMIRNGWILKYWFDLQSLIIVKWNERPAVITDWTQMEYGLPGL